MSPQSNSIGLAHTEAFAALRYSILNDLAADVAKAFYGVSWTSATVRDNSTWRTRRFPVAQCVARVLEPLLDGLVRHDGRSTAEGRMTGWHYRAGDTWRELSLELLAAELFTATQALLADVYAANAHARARGTFTPDDSLRAAIVESFSAMLGQPTSKGLAPLMSSLKDRAAFKMDDAAIDATLAPHLADAIDTEGWLPGQVIAAPDLTMSIMAETPCGLQKRVIVKSLDRIIGPRIMRHGYPHWRLPK